MGSLLFLVAAAFVLQSCVREMPFDRKSWESTTQVHAGGTKTTYFPVGSPVSSLSAAATGLYIDCFDGGTGCQSEVDFWGVAYDQIIVYRNALDSFYSHYFTNDLSYLTKNKLNELFPDLESERPGAIDSVLKGAYKIWVMGQDSSIVVISSPVDSLQDDNRVWAIDRANPNYN